MYALLTRYKYSMHIILYTFRRCPYAMRSRLALKYAGIPVELREIDLNHMPHDLLDISPKATVPVLVLPDGNYLDESWEIVKWAVKQNDPDKWLGEGSCHLAEAEMLIEMNDFSFKEDLDHYKYADRHPQHPAEYYRKLGEEFLQDLEERLTSAHYLHGDTLSIADIGIFPFVRQFALVDQDWFEQAPYPGLQRWLGRFLDSDFSEAGLFTAVMEKHPLWQAGDEPVFLNKA